MNSSDTAQNEILIYDKLDEVKIESESCNEQSDTIEEELFDNDGMTEHTITNSGAIPEDLKQVIFFQGKGELVDCTNINGEIFVTFLVEEDMLIEAKLVNKDSKIEVGN